MPPPLSITTDYHQSTGDPEPALRRIAAAGFTHIHWCHHWYTDYLYSSHEVAYFKRLLADLGLLLLNLHASSGQEKNWASPKPHVRQAGLELVRNRIRMALSLGSHVVILHVPSTLIGQPPPTPQFTTGVHRSMAALVRYARSLQVTLALENMAGDDYTLIDDLLARHDPADLGICYDSGHGNMTPGGLDALEARLSRLVAVHLHDNDGRGDLHNPPFSGTIDWPRLARLLSASPCRAPLNLEVTMLHAGIPDEVEFLQSVHQAGCRLAGMIPA